jgi:feruloyl esterase
MTSAMLAAYPEVFAAGAIIAGLPYGAAANVQEAFDSMFNGRSRPAKEWGDLVRAASPHRGPWPRVSVWHGTADATVAPLNAQEIVKQWTDVHGVAHARPDTDEVSGYPRRVWRSRSGEALVEEYTITGMAHGTPLAPATAMDPHGEAGPFLLDVGIASSYHIAAFWGLTEAGEVRARSDGVRSEPRTASRLEPGQPEPRREPKRPKTDAVSSLPSEIKGVITRALRSAGLMGP